MRWHGCEAADEARHAELSWRFVKWALEQAGGELRGVVEAAFARAIERQNPAASEPGVDREAWRAHGRLTPDEQREILRQARQQVVEPCARALLA
jgi:hypothetical protein